MGFVIFFSYSKKDSNLYQIPRIAEELQNYSEIDKVLYYEGSDYANIYKFMNDNIGKCDVLISFCSQNALESRYIELELQAALSKEKNVIPVFTDSKFIPPLLGPSLGVQYNDLNFKGVSEEIYRTILKTTGMQKASINQVYEIESEESEEEWLSNIYDKLSNETEITTIYFAYKFDKNTKQIAFPVLVNAKLIDLVPEILKRLNFVKKYLGENIGFASLGGQRLTAEDLLLPIKDLVEKYGEVFDVFFIANVG